MQFVLSDKKTLMVAGFPRLPYGCSRYHTLH